MNINWKLRFKNKVTLYALIAAAVNFIYTLLQIFEVVPKIDEATLLEGTSAILVVLSMLGIITDPTTSGMSDSKTALEYEKPKLG